MFEYIQRAISPQVLACTYRTEKTDIERMVISGDDRLHVDRRAGKTSCCSATEARQLGFQVCGWLPGEERGNIHEIPVDGGLVDVTTPSGHAIQQTGRR
jgi:hypothetical protein